MLTEAENELLTRIGPGTPMGELMRRYWQPIAGSSELIDQSTKQVRLLGEDLVLYKDKSGTFGLIEPLCAHRRINMLYGVPLDHGLRCPYHGWVYDESGACIEQPYEEEVDPEAHFKDKIHMKAYPVQELGGLLWAYMGPTPAPLLPRWEPMVRPNSIRDIGYSVLPCNYLQVMENSLDPVHLEWLHRDFSNYVQEKLGLEPNITVEHHKKIGFDVFEHGIVKRRQYKEDTDVSAGWTKGHPILFPNTLVVGSLDSLSIQIRVPVDDTHTLHIFYGVYTPGGSGYVSQDSVPVFKIPTPTPDENGQPPWHLLDTTSGQDIFAWITQGPIAVRTKERLGRSDEGIILYRNLLKEQVAKLQSGDENLMNVFRDPNKADNIEIVTEHDHAKFPGGPAAKYSPVREEVRALWAAARA